MNVQVRPVPDRFGDRWGQVATTCPVLPSPLRGRTGRSPASDGLHPSDQRSHVGSMMVVIRGAPRESLNLRIPPELKRSIEEYAEQIGISINAAAIVLLDKGVRAVAKEKN